MSAPLSVTDAAVSKGPAAGATRLQRLGAPRLAEAGAARLAAARRDLTPGLPRRFLNRGGGREAVDMPPTQRLESAGRPARLTLSEVRNALGPSDLVAEVERIGLPQPMIYIIEDCKRPDPIEDRRWELERLLNEWFRDNHASGALRFGGVPSSGHGAAWEEVPPELADDLHYCPGSNSIAVAGRRWDRVRGWQPERPAARPPAEARPAPGPGPVDEPLPEQDRPSTRGDVARIVDALPERKDKGGAPQEFDRNLFEVEYHDFVNRNPNAASRAVNKHMMLWSFDNYSPRPTSQWVRERTRHLRMKRKKPGS